MPSRSPSNDHDTVTTDVLVIGGGLAATFAAISAAKFGVRVTLVDKGILGRSGSSAVSGGVPGGAFEEDDSPARIYQDVISAGGNLSVSALARKFADECTDRVWEMVHLGAPFLRKEDGSLVTYTPFGKYARSVPCQDGGAGLMLAMRKEVFHRGVQVIQETMICKLLRSRDRITGAMGISTRDASLTLFRAKAVVLAAGSATGLYRYGTGALKTTGDAYFLGYDVGAELINMEFQEFSPIPIKDGKPLEIAGFIPLMSYGGKFYNQKNERIMEKYDPVNLEMGPRHRITEAIHRENLEGRGPVVLVTRDISEERWDDLQRTEPELLRKLAAAGINYKTAPIEYVPSIHSFLGGLRIDFRAESTVKGLFAAGESAGGVFGAALGGNALSNCAVFGREAGVNAANYALRLDWGEIDADEVKREVERISHMSGRRGEAWPSACQKEVYDLVEAYLGVIRNGAGLREALGRISEIQEAIDVRCGVRDTKDVIKLVELSNQLLTAKLAATASAMREESRGGLKRDDFPQQDDTNWLKWIVFKQRPQGKIQVWTENAR